MTMSMTDELLDNTSLASQCNERERVFASEYIIDLNGVQAVLRSGCFNVSSYESAGVAATRLMGKDRVQALIEVLKAQRLSRVNLTQDSVLHEMSLLSNSSVNHYVIDDNGQVQLTEGAPEGAMRAIQSIKRKKTIRETKDGEIFITYDVELKLWDKPTPLKLMGNHVGLFPNKVELTGKNGAPVEVVTKIERVVVDAPKL